MERQHGQGRGRLALRSCCLTAPPVVRRREIPDRNCDQRDDRHVECAMRPQAHGGARGGVLLANQAAGRELEEPRNRHGGGQAEQEHDDHCAQDPCRPGKGFREESRHLRKEPRDREVGDDDPMHIASPEFGQPVRHDCSAPRTAG